MLTLFSFNSHASNNTDALFSAISTRLSYMEDVAIFKINNKRPIEDLEREEFVIKNASESAEKLGLDKNSITGFYAAQISAAKAIQYRYRADLLHKQSMHQYNDLSESMKRHIIYNTRDLNTEIRPELIRLGKEINQRLAHYLQAGHTFSEKNWPDFQKHLALRYLSQVDKRSLFDALGQIEYK